MYKYNNRYKKQLIFTFFMGAIAPLAFSAECQFSGTWNLRNTTCNITVGSVPIVMGWQSALAMRNAHVTVAGDGNLSLDITTSSSDSRYDFTGIHANNNSTFSANSVTLNLLPGEMKKTVKPIGISAIAGSNIMINESLNVNAKYSSENTQWSAQEGFGIQVGTGITGDDQQKGKTSKIFVKNANVNLTNTQASGSPLLPYLMAGIRVIRNDDNTGSNAIFESTGLVEIDVYDSTSNKNSARYNVGIYVSGLDNEVILNNSSIKVQSSGSNSSALKIGKLRSTGIGGGMIKSQGHMILDTLSSSAIPTVRLLGIGSTLKADYDTSSSEIKSANTAILFGMTDVGISGPSRDHVVRLRDSVITTTSLKESLIKAEQGVTNIDFQLKGGQSNASANGTGYLVELQQNSTAKVLLEDGAYAQGLTLYNEQNGSLDIAVKNNATWQLAYRGDPSNNISAFTSLELDNAELIAYDKTTSSAVIKDISQFILKGNIQATNSRMNLANNIVGDYLIIDGNYTTGNNTWLVDTYLTGNGQSVNLGLDGKSYTDHVRITGNVIDNGEDFVKVNNLSATNIENIESVLVFEIAGISQGRFLLKERVALGQYEYFLNKHSGNWYLENRFITNPSVDPEPGGPEGPKPTEPKPSPSNNGSSTVVMRPEIGSYLANSSIANNLFVHRLEDRLGTNQFSSLGAENDKQIWIRGYGGYQKFDDSSRQLKTKGHTYLLHAGVGLVSFGDNNEYNIGLMGAFGHYKSNTHSKITNYKSSSTAKGFAVGLYGTWFENPVDKNGAYVDSWIFWNHFRNTVDGKDMRTEKYKSKGITASIELGTNYEIARNDSYSYWLQPQLQLVYQNVQLKDFQENTGTKVRKGSANLQTRLGIKAYMKIPSDLTTDSNYRPYLALNWMHNTKNHFVSLNSNDLSIAGNRNIGEIKVGVEGDTSKTSNAWVNVSYKVGSKGYRDLQGNIGWKWTF